MYSLPHYPHPTEWYKLTTLHWHIIITRSPQFRVGSSLGVVHCMGFDKCIMTNIHHYNITQNSFTILKILYSIYPSLSSNPCAYLFNIMSFGKMKFTWFFFYSVCNPFYFSSNFSVKQMRQSYNLVTLDCILGKNFFTVF